MYKTPWFWSIDKVVYMLFQMFWREEMHQSLEVGRKFGLSACCVGIFICCPSRVSCIV